MTRGLTPLAADDPSAVTRQLRAQLAARLNDETAALPRAVRARGAS